MTTNSLFANEVESRTEMAPSDILNWYRNLYCKTSKEEDPQTAIMVEAINAYFMIVRDAIVELKNRNIGNTTGT